MWRIAPRPKAGAEEPPWPRKPWLQGPLMGCQRRARAEMALDASAEVAAGASARCDAANPLAALKKRLLRDWGRPHCTVFLSLGAPRRAAPHWMGLESGHEIRLAICKQEAVPPACRRRSAETACALRCVLSQAGSCIFPAQLLQSPTHTAANRQERHSRRSRVHPFLARQRRCACKIEVLATSPQTPVSERCRAARGKPKHSYPRLL